MSDEDIQKTSFRTRYGHYEFLIMSSGVTNALVSFMDFMNRVFQNHLDYFLIVFIDDILVYSKREDEHISHFRVLFQVLNKHQLFSKYNKFKFWLRLVAFLGHIISSDGIEVYSKKTKADKNCPRPLTPTDIRSFLGLAWYYTRFDDGFASISYSLTTLTQKKVKFEWLEACEIRFQEVKYKITSALLSTLPEGTKGFVVYYDASGVGLGCVLM